MGFPLALIAPAAFVIGLASAGGAAAQFYAKDLYVTDLSRGIEWLRCTVGQRWNPETERCDGAAVMLSIDAAAEAIAQAVAQLGPGWRLPSRAELESLLCLECEGTKIDPVNFPDTPADSFWTANRNWLAPRHVWSVNFRTGHSYGRFFPYQELAVRLVRDR
jgi:hypothetical protein